VQLESWFNGGVRHTCLKLGVRRAASERGGRLAGVEVGSRGTHGETGNRTTVSEGDGDEGGDVGAGGGGRTR